MFGLLGLGAGLLGFGSAAKAQSKEKNRQLGIIADQEAVIDEQLTEEQKAYRASLRSGGSGLGTGDFASRMFASRKFTGF